MPLPTYPFHQVRYWLDEPAAEARPERSDDAFWDAVAAGDLDGTAAALGLADRAGPALRALLPHLAAWRRRHGWWHRFGWRPAAAAAAPADPGGWLLLGGGDGPGDEPVGHALAAAGAQLTTSPVRAAGEWPRLAADPSLDGVLLLPGAVAGPGELARLAAEFTAAGMRGPLWAATRVAVGVDADDDSPAADQAALWDLPGDLRCALVDLPAELDAPAAAALVAALGQGGENRLAIRRTGAWVRRLLPVPAPEPDQKTAAALRSGTALVAGSGPLAGEFAAALAAQGAGQVLLAGPDGTARAGSGVTPLAWADGDEQALAAVLAALPAHLPLAAVAVVAESGTPSATTGARTAQLLDRLTRAYDPAAFVLLSDALLPALGLRQGATGESAVHAPFEAVAHARRNAGLPAVALSLGRRQPAGSPAADGSAESGEESAAVRAVNVGMLSHALAGPAVSLAVADISWEELDAEQLATAQALPLLTDVSRLSSPGGPGHRPGGDPAGAEHVRDRLATASDGAQLEILVELVRAHAAGVLGHESIASVPEEASLLDLGFSSFTALELRGLLSNDTGLDVSAMAVFDHPTPRALARHLHGALTGSQPPPARLPPKRNRHRVRNPQAGTAPGRIRNRRTPIRPRPLQVGFRRAGHIGARARPARPTGAKETGLLGSRGGGSKQTGLILKTVAAGMVCLTAAACTSGGSTSSGSAGGGTPTAGGDLRFATSVEPECLDPEVGARDVDALIDRNIFDSLVEQTANGGFKPWLAKSWTISPDRLTYTFTLRTGVVFHDGTWLDAAAVKATLDHAVDPKARSYYAASLISAYSGATVVNPTTVAVRLSRPSRPFLQALSTPYLGIQSPKSIRDDFKNLCQKPVGTGPFVFAGWSKGSSVKLSRNPKYAWGPSTAAHTGVARLDSLTFSFVAESSVRLGALTSGQADVISEVPPHNVALVRKVDQLLTAPEPGAVYTLLLNTKYGPLTDERVRKAFQRSVNLDKLVDSVYAGQYKRAWSVLSPATPTTPRPPRTAGRTTPSSPARCSTRPAGPAGTPRATAPGTGSGSRCGGRTPRSSSATTGWCSARASRPRRRRPVSTCSSPARTRASSAPTSTAARTWRSSR